MNPIRALWKYSGILLIATAILHILIAILVGKDIFMEMFRAGVINSVGDNMTRSTAFWFIVLGFPCFFLGHSLHYYNKMTQKPAPLFLGYYLLFFGIIGVLFMPTSGFWLFIPQGLIIIIAQR